MSDDDEMVTRILTGKPVDNTTKREKRMKQIRKHYSEQKSSRVVKVKTQNVVIIGRSRTGKSTIKSMLIDPTAEPKDLSLRAGTIDASMESFFVDDQNLVLNIIDTPGVYEHQSAEAIVRDNQKIMEAIEKCINLEITKYHLICFAFSMPAGIQSDDIDALQLFMDHLGPDVSQNSCLIITRAEAKTSDQREKLRQELLNDSHFKKMNNYFKRGIFFTGAINYDDYQNGNASIVEQYMNVLEFRKQLINEFVKDCEPFQIDKTYVNEMRRIQEEYEAKEKELKSRLAENNQNAEQRKELERVKKELDEAKKRLAGSKTPCSIS
ncbi:unnamed protein product [Adineta ricciae]|uniref:AIG1-type G domain-containing protein n=1 Tax=Adineta ricciae TaxID=249248 RepID=A0A815WHM8_ADIRI|nr:unnamed protein product [Adineta ricciae]CAF1605787.1 unnamed protein product [Adineta ricciae]